LSKRDSYDRQMILKDLGILLISPIFMSVLR